MSETVTVKDPDGRGWKAEALVIEEDGKDVRIQLQRDFLPYGEEGDTTWVPKSDIIGGFE